MSNPSPNMPHPLKLPPIHKLVSDVAPTSEVLGSLMSESRPGENGPPRYTKTQLPDDELSPLGPPKKRLTSEPPLANDAMQSRKNDSLSETNGTSEAGSEEVRAMASPNSARSSASSASSALSSESDVQATTNDSDETMLGKGSGFTRRMNAARKSEAAYGHDHGSSSSNLVSYEPGESDSASASDSPAPERHAELASAKQSPLGRAAHLPLLEPLEPSLVRNHDVRIPVYSFMHMNTPGAPGASAAHEASGTPLLPYVPAKRFLTGSGAGENQSAPNDAFTQAQQPHQQQPHQQRPILPSLSDSKPHLTGSNESPAGPAGPAGPPGATGPLQQHTTPTPQQGPGPPSFYYPFTPASGLPQYQNAAIPPQPLQSKMSGYAGAYTPSAAPYYAPGQQQLLYYAPPRGVDSQMMPALAGAMQSPGGVFMDPAKQPDILAGPGQALRQSLNSPHPEFHIIDSTTGRHLVAEAPRRRGNLPKDVTNILRGWLTSHLGNPYPTEEDKMRLVEQTGLSLVQVSNWFINARRRSIPASQRRGKNHNYSRGGESRSDVHAHHHQGSTERAA